MTDHFNKLTHTDTVTVTSNASVVDSDADLHQSMLHQVSQSNGKLFPHHHQQFMFYWQRFLLQYHNSTDSHSIDTFCSRRQMRFYQQMVKVHHV